MDSSSLEGVFCCVFLMDSSSDAPSRKWHRLTVELVRLLPRVQETDGLPPFSFCWVELWILIVPPLSLNFVGFLLKFPAKGSNSFPKLASRDEECSTPLYHPRTRRLQFHKIGIEIEIETCFCSCNHSISSVFFYIQTGTSSSLKFVRLLSSFFFFPLILDDR